MYLILYNRDASVNAYSALSGYDRYSKSGTLPTPGRQTITHKFKTNHPPQNCGKCAGTEKLTAEFDKIGSNLNQIARRFNQGVIHSQEMRRAANRCIAEIYKMKHEVKLTPEKEKQPVLTCI